MNYYSGKPGYLQGPGGAGPLASLHAAPLDKNNTTAPSNSMERSRAAIMGLRAPNPSVPSAPNSTGQAQKVLKGLKASQADLTGKADKG